MLNLKNLFGKKKTDEHDGAVQAPPSAEPKGGVVGAVAKLFDRNEKEVAKLRPIVEQVNALGPELKALSDEELKARSLALRGRFRDEVTARLGKFKDPATGEPYTWQELDTELTWTDDYVRLRREAEKEVLDEVLPEAFALVREAGDRTIGLRHFDVQLIGGSVLHSGRISEMKTGEGKTLVATLPVYLNALSGRGVHVITVNDYLAERDANWMRPIYEFLGLTVAFITNDMDNPERQRAYNSDVLYATNSEVGFDYLRDNMARGVDDIVQRPLNFAIVDEVDNILIDEARTPLIISAQVAKTERALRRQQMAKTCDGLARKLMPGVTDREVENLIDSHTIKGRINIEALMEEIRRRGALQEATSYLIDAYLVSEKSARVDNAGHLLDVADEFFDQGLITADGRAALEAVAVNAVRPYGVRQAWQKEMARLIDPFATASANAIAAEFTLGSSSDGLAQLLAHDLMLSEEAAGTLAATLEESEDKPHGIAHVIAEEMARRGLIEDSAIELIAAHLLAVPLPEVKAEATRPNESEAAVRQRHADKVANALRETTHAALLEIALQAPGSLQEADALLHDAVPDTEVTLEPEQVRTVIEALEQIAARGLLPFETMEKLWEAVRLTLGRDALRREITAAVQKNPGDAAQKISEFVEAYADERTAFLREQADVLRERLPGHEPIANRAQSGENTEQLRRALQNDLTKSGAFAEAMKAARGFVNDQTRTHQNIADHLVEEMGQWVEVPRDARRVIAALMSEGGTADQVRERVLLAVRDLPGENTELPALVSEATKQLQAWREENAAALLEKIGSHIALPASAAEAIRIAIEDGEYSTGFDHFIGEQLLAAPEVAPLAEAIEEFGARWDEFKAEQNERLLAAIEETIQLSPDALESMEELLDKPLSGPLD
ncbi:MAG: hypothetical protein M3347_08130, partial [Armatimonadota bacterium]|nr:hypothetical protein [Armatimonadota bacterium]